MLSLKSMWIYSHIQTQLLDILGVHSIHVEAVALIPRNKVTHLVIAPPMACMARNSSEVKNDWEQPTAEAVALLTKSERMPI